MHADPRPHSEDTATARAFKCGEPWAAAEVYRRYAPALRVRVKHWLRTRNAQATADDLVQEVFLRILDPQVRASFDPGRAFLPWLMVVARNLLFDWRKARRSQERLRQTLSPERSVPPVDCDVLALNRLNVLLSSLPPELGDYYRCRFIGEQAQRSTAVALGTSHQRTRTLERRLMQLAAETFKPFNTREHHGRTPFDQLPR